MRSAYNLLLGEANILIEFNVILVHSSLGVFWRSNDISPIANIFCENSTNLHLINLFLLISSFFTRQTLIDFQHKVFNELIVPIDLLCRLHPRFQNLPGELSHQYIPVVETPVGFLVRDFCVPLDLLLVGSMARNTLASCQDGSGPAERYGFLMSRAYSRERRRELGR